MRRSKHEAAALVGRDDHVGLLDQQAAQQHAAAGALAGAERLRQLHQRTGQDVGDDQVVGRALRELGRVEADRGDEAAERRDAVALGILDRDLDRLRHRCRRPAPAASTAWPWRWRGCRCRSRHRRRSPSRPDRASPATRGSRASWRACRCRRPCRHRSRSAAAPAGMPSAYVRGMDPEGADLERLERALVLGHPVLLGQHLPGPVAVAGTGRSPSPKISIRHGPSRESSRLVTTKPSSARCSSACSSARRRSAGTSRQAVQPLLGLTRPR